MTQTATITFTRPGAYDDALRSLRLALGERGLQVVSELDIASRVGRTLGIRLPPCRILYVWPSPSAAEDVYPAAAVFLPLHVVVASRGQRTDIHVLRQIQPGAENLNDLVRASIQHAQLEVRECLEGISMRPSLV